MLLGSGELGKEFTIAAKRAGQYVIACDKYDNAQVGGQAVLGRQCHKSTPWLTERHGYDPTCA